MLFITYRLHVWHIYIPVVLHVVQKNQKLRYIYVLIYNYHTTDGQSGGKATTTYVVIKSVHIVLPVLYLS